ncbi:MAG: alpha-(1-_3)-arabinofuranosyltransferase family protein [Acidimicrobiales bacterium]
MRPRSKPELAALVALAYIPFLASSPGHVSADSKQDLYLDPGRFLSRAADLWDPQVGAGTVPHQNLGYLFPTGPWFWLWDRIGVPDWVAQRLWLGTISLAAVLGARWLFTQLGTGRVGALAGAVVYMLTPYQLAFTARMSVLLLPWAALPWLVGLTMRATRTKGWRAPALFALCLVMAGGINASSLIFVGVAPLVWIGCEMSGGVHRVRPVMVAGAKVGVLAVGVSLWWMAGVQVQGRYGLPVLQLTENLRTVALESVPSDVLRGLGNWFFYGRDRLGYSVDQAGDYAGASRLVVVLSYGVPMVALALAFVLRWAHRRYFCLLIVAGMVVAVGSWPYDTPSPYGTAWKAFVTHTSMGLALRNSPRIVPVLVLGFAGLIAGSIGAVSVKRWRAVAGGGMALVAGAGLLPVWQHGYLTGGMERPEQLPAYWVTAASALDAGDHDTRVLEVPGSSFAAYQWGTTIDPIIPGLIDRPYLAREVLPSGTPGAVNLLAALDQRMQLGTIEAESIAPIARLFGVGTIALRGDLDRSGRFDTPDPLPTWSALRAATGLREPRTFGPDRGALSGRGVPAVALFDVESVRPIVRTAATRAPVVIAGDGDGIVDASAAGLLDGFSLVLESAALNEATLLDALDQGAHLVLTDSNRKRAQTWFYALRDTRGETEPPWSTAPDPTGYDFRLDPFPGTTDAARSVVEQVGGRVTATAAGGPEHPEDRAAHAVDGDPFTAWRIGSTGAPGASIKIVPDVPVQAREIRMVQATGGGAVLTRVRVSIPGNDPVVVELGADSWAPPGQVVPVPSGIIAGVQVTVLATRADGTSLGGAPRAGLAEISAAGLRIDETVRLPTDLLDRAGAASADHGLDVVLTRLRVDPSVGERRDDEARIDRQVVLPTRRSFSLSGAGRLKPMVDLQPSDAAECRSDLLAVDGRQIPLRLTGAGTDVSIEACAPVTLSAGIHRLTATAGRVTGVDLDRIVLASGRDDQPSGVAPRGFRTASASKVTVAARTSATIDAQVQTDGEPFWLVLGESSSDGWSLSVDGADVGVRQMVDGYANGWVVTPRDAGPLSARLRWGPQRAVSASLAASVVACGGCLLLALRRRRPTDPTDPGLRSVPRLVSGAGLGPAAPRTAIAGAAVALLVGLGITSPPVALMAAVTFALVSRMALHPYWLAALAPATLVASRLLLRPSLAWIAVLLVVATLWRAEDGQREHRSA